MSDFFEATRVEVRGEGLVAQVPDGWQQGRGAFGGVGIGVAIRAMERERDLPPLRALTAELPGPLLVGEPAEVLVRVLRRGSSLTVLAAEVSQHGEVRVRASGVFGAPRRDARRWQPELAPPPPAADVVALAALPPTFARHFEYRPTGPMPFSGGTEPRAEGWIRLRVPAARLGPAELAAYADAYWPSVFAIQSTPSPFATVTFGLQLTERANTLDPAEPLYYRARATAADAGFVAEQRELFTARGELVALNTQTLVAIG